MGDLGMERACIAAGLVFAVGFASTPAAGQDPGVLSRIDTVAAAVTVSLGRDTPGLDVEQLRTRLQTVAELGLRTSAVPVGDTAWGRPTLVMELVVLGTGDGAVAYAFSVGVTDDVHPARLVTRMSSRVASRGFDSVREIADALVALPRTKGSIWRLPVAVGYVGRNLFLESAEREVREAADAFANDYLAANPRR